MNIKPPKKPTKPKLEAIKSLPDKKHNWKLSKSGRDTAYIEYTDSHGGPECIDCGFFECEHCSPEVYEDSSCLREQADNRNLKKRVEYERRVEKYEAQMEYYKKEVIGREK